MSYSGTALERFERAIYLTYIELKENFKHVTKDEYYQSLYPKLDRMKTVDFDKNRIYRLADSKVIWYAKYGVVLGEVWKENDLESYWIKIK